MHRFICCYNCGADIDTQHHAYQWTGGRFYCGDCLNAAMQQGINYAMDPLRYVEVKPRVPPYVTVADCGHCFEDAGGK